MELILTQNQNKITQPFVFKSGMAVFSIEQALWHTYHNWRESDFLLPDFEKWVREVLQLTHVANELNSLREEARYPKQLFMFLSVIDYFDLQDLSTLRAKVVHWQENHQPLVLNNQAAELFNLGDKENGLALFERAYSLDKTNVEVMLNYAQALLADDQIEKAFRYVRKAENLCEDQQISQSKIDYLDAKICRKLKNMDQALNHIKKAVAKEPINDYYYEWADIQVETRRYNDAIETLAQAPDRNVDYYRKLADVHDAAADYAGAIKAIHAIHDTGKATIETLTALAGYHRKNYDLDSAKQVIAEITDIDNHPLAQIELAKIKKATGRLHDYQKIMDQILIQAKKEWRQENGWT